VKGPRSESRRQPLNKVPVKRTHPLSGAIIGVRVADEYVVLKAWDVSHTAVSVKEYRISNRPLAEESCLVVLFVRQLDHAAQGQLSPSLATYFQPDAGQRSA
jgi:hypothetical protein